MGRGPVGARGTLPKQTTGRQPTTKQRRGGFSDGPAPKSGSSREIAENEFVLTREHSFLKPPNSNVAIDYYLRDH